MLCQCRVKTSNSNFASPSSLSFHIKNAKVTSSRSVVEFKKMEGVGVAQQTTPMPQVQLPAHMDLHVKQQYKCDLCDYSSTRKENLARHKETHKCHKCEFRANAWDTV